MLKEVKNVLKSGGRLATLLYLLFSVLVVGFSGQYGMLLIFSFSILVAELFPLSTGIQYVIPMDDRTRKNRFKAYCLICMIYVLFLATINVFCYAKINPSTIKIETLPSYILLMANSAAILWGYILSDRARSEKKKHFRFEGVLPFIFMILHTVCITWWGIICNSVELGESGFAYVLSEKIGPLVITVVVASIITNVVIGFKNIKGIKFGDFKEYDEEFLMANLLYRDEEC